MKTGFTTGSCSAAAAKAACYMLLTGREKKNISILTPKGIEFNAQIVDCIRAESMVRCAVIKDGGDDPDVTTGAHIFAEVSLCDIAADGRRVIIEGGEGVGRVTMPGLDQPVGNAAINHVPREMIEKEVLEVCEVCDYLGGVRVLISVPEGEQIAQSTFNPRLGIVGGISILGTSGVVEPMSSQALLDTIEVELRQKRALGQRLVAVSPGNYGLDFMKNAYDYDLDKSVKCSNFIGDTIDMAAKLGFEGMLLTGHIGKLIKVSGGIMNTHSKEGDCRMELLAASALRAGASAEIARDILKAVTTDDGIRVMQDANFQGEAMKDAMSHIMFYLNKRAGVDMKIECIMYSNQYGLLAKSDGADKMLQELMRG